MASKVGLASPKEAERQLVTMIEEGSIFARISQKDGNNLKPNFKELKKEKNFGENWVTFSAKIYLVSTFRSLP